jgi:hypothetical protein
MPSSVINSDDGVISGTSGLKSSGGDDGVLVFQSKGTETARINTDKQIVAAAGTASLPALTTTGDVNTGIFFPAADTIAFAEGGAEAMRIDSSGNVGIGATPPTVFSGHSYLQMGAQAVLAANKTLSATGQTYLTHNLYYDASGTLQVFNTTNANEGCLYQQFDGIHVWSSSAATTGTPTVTERARITSGGALLVGTTVNVLAGNTAGINFFGGGEANFSVNGDQILYLNRMTNDGILVDFRQDNTVEGSISVSGSTVSYNGGHLSRWAQMLTKPDLLKGTVMSNLDEMNVYVDADGNPVENEQLNKVKVSDVEGDANVAGVFVNWEYDKHHQVDEINMAMTGDMIIRIAEGVTVARGDLLMSAGDGTAKPQGDDIVRSKTIAKVTSTHVTCTYDDGSYCVPCVLMAC